MEYETNVPMLDMAEYIHYWRGEVKSGKTTTWRDLILEQYGDEKYGLLLSIGIEKGYTFLSRIKAKRCPSWSDFIEVVDDLVENKKNNEFKMIAIDTVDELIEIAEKRVLEIHRAQKGESALSINAALGGFQAGQKRVVKIIKEQLSRIRDAGYGLVYIGHMKIKNVTEKATELVYQNLTGSLEYQYDAIFANQANIIGMIVNESDVKDERLQSTQRKMYLRKTPFIDAGSHFGEALPLFIELSAKNYAKAINDALEIAAGKTGSEAEKIRKQEEQERTTKGFEFSNKEREQNNSKFTNVEELRNEMLSTIKQFSDETKNLMKEELKKANLPIKFSDVEDLEILKKIHKIISRES